LQHLAQRHTQLACLELPLALGRITARKKRASKDDTIATALCSGDALQHLKVSGLDLHLDITSPNRWPKWEEEGHTRGILRPITNAGHENSTRLVDIDGVQIERIEHVLNRSLLPAAAFYLLPIFCRAPQRSRKG